MNAKIAIKLSLDSAESIAQMYLQDLDEKEMLHRPNPGCNHIKWQLGHLILSEREMIESCLPGSMPDLPESFLQRYSRDKAISDDPADFDTKATLLAVYRAQREGTLAALASVTNDELTNDAHEKVRDYAPTVASVFILQGTHWLMHAGQWAVIRRQLGREPVI